MNENLELKTPPNRTFGFFFALLFFTCGAYFYIYKSPMMAYVMVSVSISFLLITLINDSYLAPLNALWMKFGALLGRIVSPLVIGAIFFLMLTPISLLMRLGGRDELRLKSQNRITFWRERERAEPLESRFKNQF